MPHFCLSPEEKFSTLCLEAQKEYEEGGEVGEREQRLPISSLSLPSYSQKNGEFENHRYFIGVSSSEVERHGRNAVLRLARSVLVQ